MNAEKFMSVSLSAQFPNHLVSASPVPFNHPSEGEQLLQTTPPGFESPQNSLSSKRKRQPEPVPLSSSSSSDESSDSDSSADEASGDKPTFENKGDTPPAKGAAKADLNKQEGTARVKAQNSPKKRKLDVLPPPPPLAKGVDSNADITAKAATTQIGPRGRGLHIPKETLHADGHGERSEKAATISLDKKSADEPTHKEKPASLKEANEQRNDAPKRPSPSSKKPPPNEELRRKSSTRDPQAARTSEPAAKRRSRSHERATKPPVKAKTLCRYFARGICEKGASCDWSHDWAFRSSPSTEKELGAELDRMRAREERQLQEMKREERARGERRSGENQHEEPRDRRTDRRDPHSEERLRRARSHEARMKSSEGARLREKDADAYWARQARRREGAPAEHRSSAVRAAR